MTRYVAFLRGINVGGRTVRMTDLRAPFERMELSSVETFIASGNVIFEAKSKRVPALERKIETCLLESLGYTVATFVRTDREVAAVAQARPFPERDIRSAGAYVVEFRKEPLTRAELQRIRQFATDIDRFHIDGREIYWLCRTKQSGSTFSNAALERALKIQSTFRGMNSIARLAGLLFPA